MNAFFGTRTGRWTAAVAVLLAQSWTLYSPDLPVVDGGLNIPGIDKIGHFAMFAVVTLALLRVLPVGWALAAMAAQLVLSEWVQGALLPHRSAEWGDLLADLLGVVVGWTGWRLTERRPHLDADPV